MKILKKGKIKTGVLATLVFALLSISTIAVPANASSVSKSYSGSFSSAWERYATGDSGKASLTYGYNTFLINEDYAWAKHNTKSHYAALYNGSGWHTGSGKSAGSTSKIEVTHKGSSIKYYCYY